MQLDDQATRAIQAWHAQAENAQAWLARHCASAPQPEGARISEGVVLWRQESDWLPVALWPSGAEGQTLLGLADDVRQAARGLVSQLDDGHLGIGYPVRDPADDQQGTGALVGAVALRVALPASLHDDQRAQAALMPLMQRLEEGVAVLERDLVQRTHRDTRRRQQTLARQLELLAAVLAENRFKAASMQLVTRLATLFNAERVTLGWQRGARCRVVQISHSAQFNRKMNRIRATELAMSECLDQRASVAVPPPEEAADHARRVSHAHRRLQEMTGLPSVLTLPCLDDGKPLGAVTLEREAAFSAEEADALESLMALCTRALEEKRLNDRPLPVKAAVAVGQQCARLVGPGYLGYKLTAIVLGAAVAFATLATGTERVAADATLESLEQQVLAAPFRGYIDAALVRPGDTVAMGEVLAEMDTRELVLEQLQWQSELAKLARQEQQQRAAGERAAVNVIGAQQDQAQARLELVESRLQRASLQAPFAGRVLSGDLTQRLGGVVEQGEELFRLSPLDAYRIELEVPEGRIDALREGQKGELVLAAMTGERFAFEVERLTPQTRSVDGSNRFVVEASLESDDRELRPGMQGVGRIEVGEARLISIWTRELVDWLRLTLWRWWG
ncbi:RND family efflux transporter, MFP subunit [Franzmannia pantelleriensis]|uniref:RND family efflux transporter, MFP subunit n=1 Tax=Franzmannia pantelleriensis TaxID=48727 RepID=A0A1G9E6U9_9GAMM|nr:efflux RND transporter periplasmic adaptor subunit [Halomonas pantelleriensis]SDK71808.1 RND family efflux transporter, MFP subunit [Halomonas pantelleriensis]